MDEKQPLSIADLSPVVPVAPVTLGEPPVATIAQVPIADTLEKATVWSRLIASLGDGCVLLVLAIPFFVLAAITNVTAIIYLFYPIAFGYSVYFIHKDGATPGKKAMHIKVVSKDGKPISLMQAFLREIIGKILSSLFFDLGYAWAIWDKDKQTWHDKIAGTYVVKDQ